MPRLKSGTLTVSLDCGVSVQSFICETLGRYIMKFVFWYRDDGLWRLAYHQMEGPRFLTQIVRDAALPVQCGPCTPEVEVYKYDRVFR